MLDTSKYSDWFDNMDEWGLFDEDGIVAGVKPDAPQNVIDSYEAMQREYTEARKQGIRL